MLFYCNIKDNMPHDQRNHIIYKIKCHDCNGCYISKTERCLITMVNEYGTKETKPMFKHLSVCESFKNCYLLYFLLSLFNEDEHDDISLTLRAFNAALQNHEVLDNNPNWPKLAFFRSVLY